jgi:hypothetical protein
LPRFASDILSLCSSEKVLPLCASGFPLFASDILRLCSSLIFVPAFITMLRLMYHCNLEKDHAVIHQQLSFDE